MPLKNLLNKFSKKPATSRPFALPVELQTGNAPAAPAPVTAAQPAPVKERKATFASSSPFANGAKVTPIEKDQPNQTESIAVGSQQPAAPRNATDEIMGMLAKAGSQLKNPDPNEEIHEVAFDLKSDIGWEAELEKAAAQIRIMTPEEFKQAFGLELKKATVAARYNLVEIFQDVLKNGNRSHAFDRIVETARNLNAGGHHEQLVVVGEFTYMVKK